MKKNKKIGLAYFISLLFGLYSFFLLENLVFSLGYAFINFVLLYTYILSKYEKNRQFIASLDEFQHLANSLVMQLTATPSLNDALNSIAPYFSLEIKEVIDDDITVQEKIETICRRYSFIITKVFTKVIELYIIQGGNIVNMTMELLGQIDHYQISVNDLALDNKKKISEIAVLWLLAISGIAYLKIALSVYYANLLNSDFQYVIILFLLVFSFSVYLVTNVFSKIKV